MKYLLTLSLIFYTIVGFGQADEIVTNKIIVQLHKAGLGKEVLISKIQSSKCNFDLSTDELIKLKQSGVPDDVIAAMLNKLGNSTNKVKGEESGTLSDLTPGIYYCKGTPCEYVELETSVYSQANTGSGMLTGLTYGIAKTKNKATLSGVSSNFKIENNSNPFFYFYFDKSTSNNFGNSGGQSVWFASATSPNEFILVKFSISSNKKNREVVTGSWNSYEGMTTGIDDKNKIEFKFEKISKGIYKVFTEKPLEKGQYCFMYAGGATTYGHAPMQKVYDFSVE